MYVLTCTYACVKTDSIVVIESFLKYVPDHSIVLFRALNYPLKAAL